ncbi:3-phosphoshikimate 1-carboxyvinyltransferase [Streptococcus halichoeri]|uniref:3-phosphoshikimate 1-carboxyvinyltransferase n=1 Tax=Streptococcus halichoeri TaxID=254785 RepID=UPI00135A465B|nr:3-phosphoshikimate 1-carboxyvinyltransferase [Streptococcus halichoeri]
MQLTTKSQALRGTITLPGDKSISHRALILGAIAQGDTEILGLLDSEDVARTQTAFCQLGVTIIEESDKVIVQGRGSEQLKAALNHQLDMGNAGTAMRLIAGVLAAQPLTVSMVGDSSLSRRPMDRICLPLNRMGAQVTGQKDKAYPPLRVKGQPNLRPITYKMPIASAQVKSAILLAALQTKGETTIIEPVPTRNHTEQMITLFGGDIKTDGHTITIRGPQTLRGTQIRVPGDISSAAFWLAAGLLVPDSEICLKQVGINPTRTGILDVIRQMGGDIELKNQDKQQEMADILVRSSSLKGITIQGSLIPRLIDELPIIALMATQAKGQTLIKDAQELRVKETDRIQVVADLLKAMGAQVTPRPDGMIIHGPTPLHGFKADAKGDHRIGMVAAIAALLVTKGTAFLENAQAIQTSYPQFFHDLERLQHG